MKKILTIQNLFYLIIFAGIIIANIASTLYGTAALHPLFLAGVFLAAAGVIGAMISRRIDGVRKTA